MPSDSTPAPAAAIARQLSSWFGSPAPAPAPAAGPSWTPAAPDDDAGSSDGSVDEAPKLLGRRTAIDKPRLETFNFKEASRLEVPDATTLSREERSRYIDSVLRFVPVEVAMRYFDRPLVSAPDDDAANRGSSSSSSFATTAYADLRHARPAPGQPEALNEQAYEHSFNAVVLFSDISGFTKLTNRLLAERGDEGEHFASRSSPLGAFFLAAQRSLFFFSAPTRRLTRAESPLPRRGDPQQSHLQIL